MKVALSVMAAALLGACTATTGEHKAPDGSSMKTVKCNSESQKCFAMASESCKDAGGTYRVVSSHSNSGGLISDVLPGQMTWYNMTYICGPSDGKMPDFAFRGPQYAAPAPALNQQPSRPTTTNCSRIGNNVNCTTR